ncbi:MAG TPA: hypothetical protein VFY65_08540 [Longimicrobium sp.]|nr:hypothetical protein [Longimicrobium sp.]
MLEFFADRNLGVKIFPGILRAEGITVHLHQDHFAQDAADVDWMPEVARRGWPIISPDIRISRDRLEVEAIMTSGAAVFCLAGGHLTGEEKARNFLRCLPQIASVLARTPRPFIAKVYQPNRDDPEDTTTRRVDVKLTRAEWERRRG